SCELLLVHAPKPPPSSLHWKVAVPSADENVKCADVALVGLAGLLPAAIVTPGGVVSTVKVLDAGVASTLPAGSLARTVKVCEPSASAPSVSGEEQLTNAPPSTWHSKLAVPSGDENVNVGVLSVVGAGSSGPEVIDVSGGVVSMLQV